MLSCNTLRAASTQRGVILLLNCIKTLCAQQEEPTHGRGVCEGEGVGGGY